MAATYKLNVSIFCSRLPARDGMFLVPTRCTSRSRLMYTAVCLRALTLLATVVVPVCAQDRLAPYDDCAELNQLAATEIGNGQLQAAETVLSNALISASHQPHARCTADILTELAQIMLISRRLAEAERMAEEALSILEKIYRPDDVALLHPLQILSAARLNQRKLGPARQAFRRMQVIRAKTAQDRALIHSTAAMISDQEGKDGSAEPEYQAAITALEQAGRIDTGDGAVLVAHLGEVYARQKRFEEAMQAFDRAFGILSRAKDTVPVDLIAFLNLRAVVSIRLRNWPNADADLNRALTLASHERQLDPVLLQVLLRNYSVVLRHTNRKREAHSLDARAATLQNGFTGIVDISELLHESKVRAGK